MTRTEAITMLPCRKGSLHRWHSDDDDEEEEYDENDDHDEKDEEGSHQVRTVATASSDDSKRRMDASVNASMWMMQYTASSHAHIHQIQNKRKQRVTLHIIVQQKSSSID